MERRWEEEGKRGVVVMVTPDVVMMTPDVVMVMLIHTHPRTCTFHQSGGGGGGGGRAVFCTARLPLPLPLALPFPLFPLVPFDPLFDPLFGPLAYSLLSL